MDSFDREIFRDAIDRNNKRRLGTSNPCCVICGLTDSGALTLFERDHVAGIKCDDTTVILCRNHHALRSQLQWEEPPGGDDPRNPFEVIGRWLLSMAEYFELLVVTLRRFGEFLIELARDGYGSEFTLPT